jgi:circadian clock protein KaiC
MDVSAHVGRTPGKRISNGRGRGSRELPKSPTGIAGLDEITGGGLPRGRPTLVCGAAGCGKTLMAMEFLIRGATQFEEPGVFMAFEETADELIQNVRSLGFDLDVLAAENKVVLEHVHVERSELEENGEYDLDGLFIRLGYAIESIGAKRVVLDTLETLFAGLSNQMILRAELRRLFRWLKDRGVTVVITGERGEGALTRNGLEEYVSDCVILLDHRVIDQVSTRRLRVVKYRGTSHGTNEYPFLIDETGFSVLPITTKALDHEASVERVTTGIKGLDDMLGGDGVYRGSSVLISGTAGTGKSSIAAHFADASCRRGERCLYFAFEESVSQITRNMRSIGLDLLPWTKKGLLRFVAGRPSLAGVETHLAVMHKQVRDFDPRMVIVDPITNLSDAGTQRDAVAMLTRLLDFLKSRQVTGVFTALNTGGSAAESTDVGVSSVIDTWLLVRDIELGGERNRGLYVLKSRGIAHSNQIREFVLGADGVKLLDVYSGPEGVLTGSMRIAQEAREQAAERERLEQFDLRRRASERRRRDLEARIAALHAELQDEANMMQLETRAETARIDQTSAERRAMERSRKADAGAGGANDRKSRSDGSKRSNGSKQGART